jgi:hypothetical protein
MTKMPEQLHNPKTPEEIENEINESRGGAKFHYDWRTLHAKTVLMNRIEYIISINEEDAWVGALPEAASNEDVLEDGSKTVSKFRFVSYPLNKGGVFCVMRGRELTYDSNGEPIGDFKGLKLVARYDLDEKGEPRKEIKYWRPIKDLFGQEARFEIRTPDGILRSGDTPLAAETLYSELALVFGDTRSEGDLLDEAGY